MGGVEERRRGSVNGRNLLAQLVKERKEDENFPEDVLDLHCSM